MERKNIPFTNEHFVEFVKKMCDLKSPYWYATCIFKCTTSRYNSKKRQCPEHYTSDRTSRYQQDINAQRISADCIGAYKGYCWTNAGEGVLEAEFVERKESGAAPVPKCGSVYVQYARKWQNPYMFWTEAAFPDCLTAGSGRSRMGKAGNRNLNMGERMKVYMSKFDIIKKYIDEYDYYALLAQGAPNDEFDSYSHLFANAITSDYSVEDIALLMAKTMDTAFGEKIKPENFLVLARKIREALFEA